MVRRTDCISITIAVDWEVKQKINKQAETCFTSIKYLPYISLNAIPLLLPIKKTPRMAPPYIDWRDFRMTIVSIVSVTSCQISFLFIAEQRSHKNFKSFVIYKDLCYNFLFFCDKAPKHLIFLVYHLFWYNFCF